MKIRNSTRWIANNLKTNPVPKIVSGLVLGALLIMGATMAFGSSHVESLVSFANVDNVEQSPESQPLTITLNDEMPYREETLQYRDQRHQRRIANDAKEAALVLNEQMPYREETLEYRDQRHARRVAVAEAKEATIALNEQMPYFEETLHNRDQQWERRNPTTGSTVR